MDHEPITREALLDDLNVDEETADELMGLLSRETDPRSIEAVDRWVRRCFHEPDEDDQILRACDEVLGTHGVEGIPIDEHYPVSYCNTGDTYAFTLCLEHRTGTFFLGSWGDTLTELEKEYETGDYERFDEEPRECRACGKRGMIPRAPVGECPGAWICHACNHYHLAVDGLDPAEPRCSECGETYPNVHEHGDGLVCKDCCEHCSPE